MARTVACLAALALGVLVAMPASAGSSHGYIAVTRTQIDPHMAVLSDGPPPSAQPDQQAPNAQDNRDNAAPLDQADSGDDSGPAGDDPYADNAVETDTVYTI